MVKYRRLRSWIRENSVFGRPAKFAVTAPKQLPEPRLERLEGRISRHQATRVWIALEVTVRHQTSTLRISSDVVNNTFKGCLFSFIVTQHMVMALKLKFGSQLFKHRSHVWAEE